MATNWAKDGLDAYLSLTGEHRAQQKADADAANQKKMMDLAVNQDARAATTAGLTNQLTGMQIKESERKNKDLEESDLKIGNYIKWKAGSSPLTPNTNDPAAMEQAKAHAAALYQIGTKLNNMPPGAGEFPIEQLSPAEQAVYNSGPGKDLVSRIGKKHTEEGTGRTYTIAAAGPLRVVREEGKPAVVTPTMIAKYDDDGTPKEVPYTLDGTNKGDGIVRQFTGSHLIDNAGAALSAIDQAAKTGGTPSDFHSQSIYQRVMALPREQRQAWYAAELAKDQARQETSTYDKSVADAAAPYVALVAKLKGTATEKETQFLEAIKGAPSSVIAYLKSNAEVANKLFEPQAKREDAKLKADEDRAERARESKLRSEDRRFTAGGKDGTGKVPAQNQSYKLWKEVFTARGLSEEEAHTEAMSLVTEGKSNPTKDVTTLAAALLKEGIVKSMPEAITQAKEAYSLMGKGGKKERLPSHGKAVVNPFTGQAVTPPPAPAAQGMTSAGNGSLQDDVNYLRGGKPQSSNGQRLGLYFQ